MLGKNQIHTGVVGSLTIESDVSPVYAPTAAW